MRVLNGTLKDNNCETAQAVFLFSKIKTQTAKYVKISRLLAKSERNLLFAFISSIF
jgi:hypothetical protein